MLTKKHFKAVASILATTPIGDSPLAYHDRLMSAFTGYFERENPNFDPGKFFDACNADHKGEANAPSSQLR